MPEDNEPVDEDEFLELVKPLRDEMPEPTKHVRLLLVDGTSLQFKDVIVSKLAGALVHRGYVQMGDRSGASCFVFSHGVSAIIGKDDE